MINEKFFFYLLVMAGVTYLVRMLPLVLIKKKIQNRFLLSFLHYIPYTVLSAMTVPAIFYATESPIAAVFGFVVAMILAFFIISGYETVHCKACIPPIEPPMTAYNFSMPRYSISFFCA